MMEVIYFISLKLKQTGDTSVNSLDAPFGFGIRSKRKLYSNSEESNQSTFRPGDIVYYQSQYKIQGIEQEPKEAKFIAYLKHGCAHIKVKYGTEFSKSRK